MRLIPAALASLLLSLILTLSVWPQCPNGRPGCEANKSAKKKVPCTKGGRIIIKSGIPDCTVNLDSKYRGMTDDTGVLDLPISQGSHSVVISKQGYNDVPRTVQVDCHDTINMPVEMIARTFAIHVRTTPGNASVYINQELQGQSDSTGLFTTSVRAGSYSIEVRKDGYLSVSRNASISFSDSEKEISISLPSALATFILTTNLSESRIRIDDNNETVPLPDRVVLSPGVHRITISALGYISVVIPINIGPGEQISKNVNLRRLPSDELIKQAVQLFANQSFESVLVLCKYVFENDPYSAIGHKLAGLSILYEISDYVTAGQHLAKALAGNEVFILPIRRHPGERFDLHGPHNNCEGFLSFNKYGVEFAGKQVSTDNFQANYNQVHVEGLQLKKKTALFLAVRVTDARGKTRDYDFYSPVDELSQTGRPYLEMLQNLLRAH